MNLNLDLTTILALLGGLVGPIGVLVAFSKVAVKQATPEIKENLLADADFIRRMGKEMAEDREVAKQIGDVAVHKANNIAVVFEAKMEAVRLSLTGEVSALRREIERDREGRKAEQDVTVSQLAAISRTLHKLDVALARNEAKLGSLHDETPSEVDR